MAEARGSWYSQFPEYGWIDREDRPGSNALGVPDAQQGIALPSRSTLGKWFNVTAPNGETYKLQQTDIGPSARTGRGIDISAAAAHAMGYSPKNFPTDATFSFAPADGGDYTPRQERRPMPSQSLSALAPLADPTIGDRLGAGLQGFAQSGGLISALGNLVGGLATGQRQDEDFQNQQMKQRAFDELVRQHNQQAGHQNETLAENRRQFEMTYNKPQVVFKKVEDPDTGEQTDVPYIVTPGGPGKPPNVMQLDPSTFKPQTPAVPPPPGPTAQAEPPLAGAPVAGLTPGETGQIPAGAAFVQGGPQPTINGIPADIKGPARKAALKALGTKTGENVARERQQSEQASPLLGTIEELRKQIATPEYKEATKYNPLIGMGKDSAAWNPQKMIYEAAVPTKSKDLLDRIQMNTNSLELEFGRLYYQGQGAVSDAERNRVTELVGKIAQARSPEAASRMLQTLEVIIKRNLQRVPNYQPGMPAPNEAPQQGGAPTAPAAPSGGLPMNAIQQELIRRGVLNANSL